MSEKKSAYKKYKFKQEAVPYVFLLPNMLIFFTYIIIPAIMGVIYSFTNFDGLNEPKFIGFKNYVRLFTKDDEFIKALWNTIRYVAVSVPLIYVLAVVLALIIIQKLRVRALIRAAYYWPVMISFIVVGVMWQWILGDTFGIFNKVLEDLGIGRIFII